jgi:hypothetical protein
MVASSGATVRADRLRPLNAPRPIRVEADARGLPLAIELPKGRRGGAKAREKAERSISSFIPVQEIADRWRIDDEWWRQEISRMYFRVVLTGGRVLTVFQNLITSDWFLQTTATPRRGAEPLDVLVPRAAARAPAPAAERAEAVTPIRRIGQA